MKKIRIDIAKDFTLTPGPRQKIQGKYSGEEFLEEILYPKYIEAFNNDLILVVCLDGTYGYYDSFIEEAFGGLQRLRNENVMERIEIISDEDSSWIEKINKYTKDMRDSRV